MALQNDLKLMNQVQLVLPALDHHNIGFQEYLTDIKDKLEIQHLELQIAVLEIKKLYAQS